MEAAHDGAGIPPEGEKGKLRHLLAQNQPFGCTCVEVGASVLFYRVASRTSALQRRRPTVILDPDVTGVSVKFQGQTFKVAHYCMRRRVDPKGVGGGEWRPASDRSG